MDTEALPLELAWALERADKQNQRTVDAADKGSDHYALRITQDYHGRVTDYLKARLQSLETSYGTKRAIELMKRIDPELLALAGLSSVLNGVASGNLATHIYESCGSHIAAEAWRLGLTEKNPELARRVEQAARKVASGVKWRLNAAKRFAEAHEYKLKEWSVKAKVVCGAWVVDCVINALPEVFTLDRNRDRLTNQETDYFITLNPEIEDKTITAVTAAILRCPVYLPVTEKPYAWTGFTMPHVNNEVSYAAPFLRTRHPDVVAKAKACIKGGSMRPALDGVTALQSVAWKINERILGVIKGCIEKGIEVKSLPPVHPVPMPSAEDYEEPEALRAERAEAERENKSRIGKIACLKIDLQIAEALAERERFYTPMNCDWRGRVYPLCHFNFQRDDQVRALFQFADGEPIGEEGLRWLKIHVANCGDFDKISKRPLEERVAWVDAHLAQIEETAVTPMRSTAWWTAADKPFLFLAAVLELSSALRAGPSFITTLPISFDGSCSGLQHLSAMTRDEVTAKLVNLIPSEVPQDVYATVADALKVRVENDDDDRGIGKMLLAFGIDRKVTKRNVMTYSYSSKKHGMGGQQQTDLMDKLRKLVLNKKLKDHPFAPYHRGTKERPGKAARYIAHHVYETIEATINRPAQAMKFLQSIARALAHEGKPVNWTTPVGVPWVNRYHESRYERVTLWLHDKGVKKQVRSLAAIGIEKEIDKDRAANGVAPNFVHALDAAHLILTVNACVAEGIGQIATVHDSFGCLAPRATRFNQIIREQFIAMYEKHDVLAEVLARASRDLTQHNVHRLPALPRYGSLNLKEIENAKFAFA